MGTIAKYAVQQSPYHRPDNLETVLDRLNAIISPTFDKAELGVAKFEDWQDVEKFITIALAQIPEYVAWNDRKNGNDSPFQFTSRYDTDTNPDDDFIDLDALQRNVAVEIRKDQDELDN
jgi:hypothetical protein